MPRWATAPQPDMADSSNPAAAACATAPRPCEGGDPALSIVAAEAPNRFVNREITSLRGRPEKLKVVAFGIFERGDTAPRVRIDFVEAVERLTGL
jgi:hypothetical protein